MLPHCVQDGTVIQVKPCSEMTPAGSVGQGCYASIVNSYRGLDTTPVPIAFVYEPYHLARQASCAKLGAAGAGGTAASLGRANHPGSCTAC